MSTVSNPTSRDNFAFSSSVEADVWHPQKDPKSYEWWYFDALSDDGSEAMVAVFLDNFIYSPRYNARKDREQPRRFPAVSFTYFKDGKALYRSTTEFSESEFFASREAPECRIGGCSFRFESASYGSGYLVTINMTLSGGRRLEGSLEWLSIESDLQPKAFSYCDSAHCWNMVVPRSDVTGRMRVIDKKGKEIDLHHFRGTGYHDHNLDNRWLAKTVRDWHWGRVHFADATAVFYRYCENGDLTPRTRLLIIKDGELQERSVDYEEQNYVRDKFGIRYPTRLRLISQDNFRLSVKPITVIDSSFYYLRFLSEFSLMCQGSQPHVATGITEFLAPKALKYRWLNWISDMRTGKNGKAPLLP